MDESLLCPETMIYVIPSCKEENEAYIMVDTRINLGKVTEPRSYFFHLYNLNGRPTKPYLTLDSSKENFKRPYNTS